MVALNLLLGKQIGKFIPSTKREVSSKHLFLIIMLIFKVISRSNIHFFRFKQPADFFILTHIELHQKTEEFS